MCSACWRRPSFWSAGTEVTAGRRRLSLSPRTPGPLGECGAAGHRGARVRGGARVRRGACEGRCVCEEG